MRTLTLFFMIVLSSVTFAEQVTLTKGKKFSGIGFCRTSVGASVTSHCAFSRAYTSADKKCFEEAGCEICAITTIKENFHNKNANLDFIEMEVSLQGYNCSE